jgi:chromosome segregation ATPase
MASLLKVLRLSNGHEDAALTEMRLLAARIADDRQALEAVVATAREAAADLGGLTEPIRKIGVRLAAVEEQTSLIDGRVAGVTAAQEQAEALARTHDQIATRLGDTDTEIARLRSEVGDVARLMETAAALKRDLAAGESDTRRRLLTLKSLADQVTQKVSALENQRDAVERVARDVSRLDDLVARVDAAIREQEDQVLRLQTLGGRVDDLRALHESVTARSEEITHHLQEVEGLERDTHQRLADLDGRLQKAIEGFDVEHRGLETVGNRIGDLRAAVKDCEARVTALDVEKARIADLEAKVEGVWGRVGFLLTDIAKLDEQTKTMRLFRVEAQRVRELTDETAARSAEIQQAKPTVEAVARDLAALGDTAEKIKDALGGLRRAEEDVARVRGDQASTASWLQAVQEPIANLQRRVRELDAMGATLESVQKRAEWTAEAMEVATSHRHLLDDTQTRLGDLAALGVELDDRTKALRSRLEAVEGRFVLVTRQADDAERIATLVAGALRTASEADGRVAELDRALVAFEGRSQDLGAVADRAQLLEWELEQQQATLDRASEHLTRATLLRSEAADAARQLDEQTRKARATLGALDERTKHLETLSEELEGRSSALRAMESDLTRFESHLGRWEAAKRELEGSLELMAGRQATVDALGVNLKEMFDVAELTAMDLKAAVSVQRDILQSKPALDDLLVRLHEADDIGAWIDLRNEEIGEAERRLARADAVLIDIQSSLETLHNQKATLDMMIERAGALTFQIQQGEALIDRLRKERDVTNTARVALDGSSSRAARPRAE